MSEIPKHDITIRFRSLETNCPRVVLELLSYNEGAFFSLHQSSDACFVPSFCDFAFGSDARKVAKGVGLEVFHSLGGYLVPIGTNRLLKYTRTNKTGGHNAGGRILQVACIFILHMSQCQQRGNCEYCIARTTSEAVPISKCRQVVMSFEWKK
jgi:hypothetical protein